MPTITKIDSFPLIPGLRDRPELSGKINANLSKSQPYFSLQLFTLKDPNLPISPGRNGYFDDNQDTNLKWYLPELSLKTPEEGGFSFIANKAGFDQEGNDSYTAKLTLKLIRKRPANIGVSKDKLSNNVQYKEIPLTNLQGVMKVSTTDGEINLPLEVIQDPQKPEFDVLLSIKETFVKLFYRTLSEQKASLVFTGQYLAATKLPKPVSMNLLDLAPKGKWVGARRIDSDRTADQRNLPWQGNNGDSNGFVRIDPVRLEDQSVQKALVTHPKWVNQGTIQGRISLGVLPKGVKFMSQIGFLIGATGTDGVDFQVWVRYEENKKEIWKKVAAVSRKVYNGKLIPITADLSPFAGKELDIELRVDSGPSSGRDWAAWVAPRIVGNEYERQTIAFEQTFELALNCSKYPELYRLAKADGTTQAFGCQAPWGGGSAAALPQYQLYNKVNLAEFGVAAVYMSNYINNQFLVVPSEYHIARDANNQPSAFCTAKVDLQNTKECLAVLDFGVAPDIDLFAYHQIKKAIVQSWTAEDISKDINLVFPDKPEGLQIDTSIIPSAQLVNDGNYTFGLGNQFHLTLQNLNLLNAELIAKSISGENPPGRRFPFKIRVDDQLPLVSANINLNLNQLSGILLDVQAKDATLKQLTLQNSMDFELQIGKILSETPGKANNFLYELNRTITPNTALQFDLAAADTGSLLVVQAEGLIANRYFLRDETVTSDEIQQEVVIALAESVFTESPVEFVEVKLQMKDAAAKATKIFNSPAELSHKAIISLPIGYYLGRREMEYVVTIRLKDESEKFVSGVLNLREGSLLNLNRQSLGLE